MEALDHGQGGCCPCSVAKVNANDNTIESLLKDCQDETRRTKEEVGRQHQEMDRLGVRRVPEGSEE